MSEHIDDWELDAYIDGELCLQRRLAVEDQLSRDPEAAARMMADLRTRTALRLIHEPSTEAPASIMGSASELSRRLARSPARPWFPSVARWAGTAAALAVAGLMIAPSPRAAATAPPYVSEAVMSYRTALIRAGMASQIESRYYDQEEIRRRTRIRVPRLPVGWQITDVQIFPSDDGPALQIMIRKPSGRDMSMFAVRTPSAAPLDPVAIRRGASSVAYWREGDIAYALTGAETPEALDTAATSLAAQPAG